MTAAPALARPQTGTGWSRCRIIPSEKMLGIQSTSACGQGAKSCFDARPPSAPLIAVAANTMLAVAVDIRAIIGVRVPSIHVHVVAVRYAYCWNPAGANLYNREGLPAGPFRTDEW